MKKFAVLLTVRLLLAEEAAQVDRRFAWRQGIPARRMSVSNHVALGIFIVFVEGDADRHIQKIADRAPAIHGRSQFRDIFGECMIRIEQSTIGENSAEHSANRFADGENDMRRGGVHAFTVPLHRDPPAPENDESIGVSGAEGSADAGGFAIMTAEFDVSYFFQRCFELHRMA